MSSLPYQLQIHLNALKITEQTTVPEVTYSIVIDDPVCITVSTDTQERLGAVQEAVLQLDGNCSGIQVIPSKYQHRLILSYDRRQITLGLTLRVIDSTIRRAAQAPATV